jgi:iron-sulfur cluster assembly accessory protein
MAFLNIQSKNQQKLKPSFEPMPAVNAGEVAISETAAKRIEALLASEKPGSLLRVGLQGGGCSGLKPYFAFEESAGENDQVFTAHGVSICVDPKSLSLIGGSWLDFDQGFKIKSSQLKKSCSCGESFSL